MIALSPSDRSRTRQDVPRTSRRCFESAARKLLSASTILCRRLGDFPLICHYPQSSKSISQKLMNQFIGPFKFLAEHRLSDGTLAANTFDLRHVRTDAKCRPSTPSASIDFGLAATSQSRTLIPSRACLVTNGAPSSAREISIGDFLLGDMVAVRRPGDEKRFVFAQVARVGDYELSTYCARAHDGDSVGLPSSQRSLPL